MFYFYSDKISFGCESSVVEDRMLVRVAAASWIIAFLVLFVAVCSADHDPVCRNIANGRSCSLDSNAQSVAVFDDKVLVGATNHLFSFGRDLSFQESVSINPQPDKLTRCTKFGQGGLSLSEPECRNFIKVIQPVPSGYETNSVDQQQIMVCGTNAYFPKCTIHDSSSLSNYSFMTSTEDEGYSPHAGSDPIVAILASNGRFFSATHFQAFQRRRTIGMAHRPLGGDSLFTVMAPTSDPLWLNKPEFVSTYEIGDHIYFFMREPAYEEDESIIYSRAIRICKTDEGQAANGATYFLTYQKATIRCSFDGDRGSIPYNYDNLESTFLSTQPLTLYAIFSSPDNGPEGSAICRFSFDQTMEGSLTKVFEDGTYVVPDTQDGQQVWIVEGPGPFSCPGTTGTQRTPQQADRYQLVDSIVEGMDPEPLHVVSGVKLDKIAVDVITYNNSVQEVVYFTTDNGEIRQVVHVAGSQSGSQDHIIQSIGSTVHFLSVHKNEDETRQVYMTTEDRIVTISRGNCTRYKGCFECLDSSDAYCGWSQTANMCYNKLSQSHLNLIEAHSASEATTVMVCGSRPHNPQPTPGLPTSSCPFAKPTNGATVGGKVCSPATEGLSNGNGDSSRSAMNIPTIVGASVGAFVLGVPVGAFVCFIFFRLFVQPRQSKNYLEEESGGSMTQPHAHGGSQVSNIPANELVDSSGQNREKKIDLSVSVESAPTLATPYTQRGLPRYVEVQTSKSQLSCSAPSGSNGTPFTASSMEMIYKRSSVDVTGAMTSKYDSAFTASENDIVPPLVHLTGNDGYGAHKKPAKQTRFNMPATGTNGVSRTQVPGYKVPKGRTPSTTWLRENSISECSDLSSPLQSPISDV